MIGRLHGEILAKQPPQILLDVNGVGYEVEAPMSTFYDLPAVGETVTLVTHLLVREDSQLLFGFLREPERALFRHLLKVTGVGARMALAILSGMDARQFAQCVVHEDITALTRLPGIGRKTAQRLVMEMKDRLGEQAEGAVAAAGAVGPGDPRDAAQADAVSALIALGYRPADASRLVQGVGEGPETSEEMIRAALKAASSR